MGTLLHPSLWVSFSDEEEIPLLREILKKDPPGGIVLFRRHLPSLEETVSLLKKIQEWSGRKTQIAIDEEGGKVSRLPPPFPSFPSPREWEGKDPLLLESASESLACILKSLGFSLNLAPVVDEVKVPSPLLQDRVFHPEGRYATPYIRAFIRGHKKHSVLVCLKHFPNHGLVEEDTHHAIGTIPFPKKEVEESWRGFRVGIEEGGEFVMLAHLLWKEVGDLPTSVNEKVVKILRNDLHFQGMIIADDFTMKALDPFDRRELLLQGIAGGVNGFLFCGSLQETLTLVEDLYRETERSTVLRERLKETRERWNQLPPPSEPQRWEEILSFIREGEKKVQEGKVFS